MPCATGPLSPAPIGRVINLQADGSAMYTLQALWTQAREQLNVTTLICSKSQLSNFAGRTYVSGTYISRPEGFIADRSQKSRHRLGSA